MIEITTKDQLKSLTNKLYRAMRNDPNMKLSEFRDVFAANTPQQNWNALLNHFDTVHEESQPCTPPASDNKPWFTKEQFDKHMTTFSKPYVSYVIRQNTGVFKKLTQECIHQAESLYIHPLAVTEDRELLEVLVEIKRQSIRFMFRVGNTAFGGAFEITDKVDYDEIQDHCVKALDKLRVSVDTISSYSVANYINLWVNVITVSQCTNHFGYITTSHPKNNADVLVEYDENYKVSEATYLDNNERGDMVILTDPIVKHFQNDIDNFVVKHDQEDQFRAAKRQASLLEAFDAKLEQESLTLQQNTKNAEDILKAITKAKDKLPHMEVGEHSSSYLDIHFSSKLFDFPEEANEDFRDLELSMTYDISDNSVSFTCQANDGDGGFDSCILKQDGKIKQDASTSSLSYGDTEIAECGIMNAVTEITSIINDICKPNYAE